jgi:flagellar hook protein FlgE
MMRALFSAISGMRNHMAFMDVVGNNIANVNTTAYKSSQVTFQDILGQTQRGASSPQNGRGGTNPAQIGLGMQLGGISNVMSQGSLQSTGKLTDFAVQGDGFFVVNDGTRNYYTRDGSFDIDVAGNLVNPNNGLKVQGWLADATGTVATDQPTTAIKIPFGTQVSAKPTADSTGTPPVYGIVMAGNLDSGLADTAPGNVVSSTVTAYDSLGNAHTIALTFTKTAANTWTVAGTEADPANPGTPLTAVADQTLTFTANGQVDTTAAPGGVIQVSLDTTATGATNPLAFNIDMSSFTQFAGTSQVTAQTNTGSPAGALVSFAVGPSGEVSGIYSNGSTQKIGQLALASFANSGGLQRSGENLWSTSAASGEALVVTPNENGRGSISTGTLETSNVDLAQQFTDVIIAQRGFQSSSKVITASDQMLQDLVSIIR